MQLFIKFSLLFLLSTSCLIAQDALPSVPDPYRWLEDSDNQRTEEWLDLQQIKLDHYLEGNPYRTEIKKTLQKLVSYESYSSPIRRGNRFFYKMRLPREDQMALYVQEGKQGKPRVLFNPNKMPIQPVAIDGFAPSPDGELILYGLAISGSDWTSWNLMEVSTGKILDDRLVRTKSPSITWSPDCKSFFYVRLDTDNLYRIYQHQLGNSQSEDTLVYENSSSKDYTYALMLSSDQKYLLIDQTEGSSGPNALLYSPLDMSQTTFQTLLPMGEGNHSYVCNVGSKFYCLTDVDASMGKVIAIDVETQTENEIIGEGTFALEQVELVGDYLITAYSYHATSRLTLYDLKGAQVREITLPNKGKVVFSERNASRDENEIFFSFTHFVQPPMIYSYHVEKDRLKIFKQPKLQFNPDNYVTKQIFYTSKDGTEVPLFIVHKKGLELNGSNETLLYAYGGFNIGLSPHYNTLNMAWLEHGGVFALANIRGGSEYGKEWHEAAMKENKQNCFDDFIAAAEWLIDNGYTNPSKLAIRGASNGGLLTAVCSNQRPDLYRAALVEVGVLDMLRFHLFTAGHFWMVEYGNPEDPRDFQFLYKYSPYHNIRTGINYPSIMVTTGDHDDRVVPYHSYKYTAAMQEALDGNGTILLRLDRHGGHGAGKSVSQWIEEVADTLSFLKQELGGK